MATHLRLWAWGFLLGLGGFGCLSDLSGEEWKWTPEATLEVQRPACIQVSPNGREVVYTLSKPVIEEQKSYFQSHIYKALSSGLDEGFQFTQGKGSCVQPQWSPDGMWIAFISNREGSRNLYVIRSHGGEAIQLTDLETGVQTFAWAPNSETLAFVAEESPPKKDQIYSLEEEPRNRLFLVSVQSKQNEPRALTGSAYHVRGTGDFGIPSRDIAWAPEGQEITFAYSPEAGVEAFWLDSKMATVDLATGNISEWDSPAPFVSNPLYSPDGEWIAFLKSDSEKRFVFQRQVWLRSRADGTERQLAQTFNGAPLIREGGLVGWTEDSKNLLFFEPKGVGNHLVALPIDGSEAQELLDTQYLVTEFTLNSAGSHFGVCMEATEIPPEVYVCRVDGREAVQVTRYNQWLLDQKIAKTELLRWKAKDGMEIEGLLTYPQNYEEGKAYPLILEVHGGPMGSVQRQYLGRPYVYPFAAMAQEGFAILRCNPRGSTGYGLAFLGANYQDWGGGDFQDLMTGVDTVIKMGVADPERLGIMGWSYGGYMTAWTISQTSRFKAASMGAGLTNLISMAGTSDLKHFIQDYFQTKLSGDTSKVLERSPLTHVGKVQTPLLIQHGELDQRVPLSQSIEFYRALKGKGSEVTFEVFPRTPHGPREPKLMAECMQRNLDWFKQHL